MQCGCIGNGMSFRVLKANPSPLFLWLENNSPPRAHAGGKHVLVLPNNSVILDGSGSADDQGIVSYLWIRDGQSPAAGVSFLKVVTKFGFCYAHNAPAAGRAGMTHKMLSGMVPVSDLSPLLSVMLRFKRLVIFSVQLENIVT